MGIDFCNKTERLNLYHLFDTKKDMDIKPLYTYLCPVIMFICFFSIIFNAILMSISRQSKVVHKSPILLLSLNLAVTDLIASLLNGLGILLNSYLPEVYNIRMGTCSMLMFEVIRYAALVASALHLLALAFVHYRGIVNPLHYRSTIFFSQHLSRTINIISITCWIIPLTIMIVWFSSVPCQGFTFRYMVLTLFALPLLLMSAIYMRIFIIISRHQKGRRMNGRTTLGKGVISAAGPIVTAAAVNLPELITNTNAVVRCAACAARARLEIGTTDYDPTIFILSEETIDNTEQATDDRRQQMADLCSAISESDSADNDENDNQKFEDETDINLGLEEKDADEKDGFLDNYNNYTVTSGGNGKSRSGRGAELGGASRGGQILNCDRDSGKNPMGQSSNVVYNGPNSGQKMDALENPKAIVKLKSALDANKRGIIFVFGKIMFKSRQKFKTTSIASKTNPDEKSSSTATAKATLSGGSSTSSKLVSQGQVGLSGPTNELLKLTELKASGRLAESNSGCSGGAGDDGTDLNKSVSPHLLDSKNQVELQVQEGQQQQPNDEEEDADEKVSGSPVLMMEHSRRLGKQVSAGAASEGSNQQRRKYRVALNFAGPMDPGTSGATLIKEVKLVALPSDGEGAAAADIDLPSCGQMGDKILLKEIPKQLYGTKQLSLKQRQTSMKRQQSNPVQLNSERLLGGILGECTCDNKSRQYNSSKLSRANTIGGKRQEFRERSSNLNDRATGTTLNPIASSNKSLASSSSPASRTNLIRNKMMVTLSSSQGPSISSSPVSLKHKLLYRSQTITSAPNRSHGIETGTSQSRLQQSINLNSSTTEDTTTIKTQPSSSTFEPQRRHVHASAMAQTNTKALVTTLLILGTYLISYVPTIAFQALTCTDSCPYPLYDISFSRRVLLGAMTNLLLIAKSIIDPFIYSYRMNEIQLAITRYFSKRRSKTSFAHSLRTSQNNNYNNNNRNNISRSFHNSNYQPQQQASKSNHPNNKQHNHHDLNSNHPTRATNMAPRILRANTADSGASGGSRLAFQTITTTAPEASMAMPDGKGGDRGTQEVEVVSKLLGRSNGDILGIEPNDGLSNAENGQEQPEMKIGIVCEGRAIESLENDSKIIEIIEPYVTSTSSSSDQRDRKYCNDKSFITNETTSS